MDYRDELILESWPNPLWFFCSSSAGTGSTRRSNVRSELLLVRPRRKPREPLLLQLTISLPVNFYVCCFLSTHLWFGCDAKSKVIILNLCWTTQNFFPSSLHACSISRLKLKSHGHEVSTCLGILSSKWCLNQALNICTWTSPMSLDFSVALEEKHCAFTGYDGWFWWDSFWLLLCTPIPKLFTSQNSILSSLIWFWTSSNYGWR